MVQTYQDNATDAHGGDRAFEGQLVGQLPYLNRLALALCHNHEQAKDLAQETAAKAWRGTTGLRDRLEFPGVAVHDPAQRIPFRLPEIVAPDTLGSASRRTTPDRE